MRNLQASSSSGFVPYNSAVDQLFGLTTPVSPASTPTRTYKNPSITNHIRSPPLETENYFNGKKYVCSTLLNSNDTVDGNSREENPSIIKSIHSSPSETENYFNGKKFVSREIVQVAMYVYGVRKANYERNRASMASRVANEDSAEPTSNISQFVAPKPASAIASVSQIKPKSILRHAKCSRERTNKVRFNDEELELTYEIPRVDPEDWSALFYEEEEMAEFRYEQYVESLGLDMTEFETE